MTAFNPVVFATLADAAGTIMDPAMQVAIVERYDSNSTPSWARYVRVPSNPGIALSFQDSASVWWAISPHDITAEAGGALGDLVRDDTVALQRAIDTAWVMKAPMRAFGSYAITGISYYDKSHLQFSGAGKLLMTASTGFCVRALQKPGDTRVLGVVNDSRIFDLVIDMNSQGWAGLFHEGGQRADLERISVLNVPNSTFSYDDGGGLGAFTYPTMGFGLKGITGVAGCYYNRLIHPRTPTQAAQGARAIWLGTTMGGTSTRANFNWIEFPVLNGGGKGHVVGIDINLAGDTMVWAPEVSWCGTGIKIGRDDLSANCNRTTLDKVYAEECGIAVQLLPIALNTELRSFCSTSGTTTPVSDTGIGTKYGSLPPYVLVTKKSGVYTFNALNGNSQSATITAAGPIVFTGWSAKFNYVDMFITNGAAFTLTWPTITWLAGSVPTLRASGVNHVRVWTTDGGATLFGELVQ